MKLKSAFLSTLLLLVFGSCFAQANGAPPPDEGMDLFLLLIAGVFIGAMFSAAVAASLLACLVLLSFLLFVGFGFVSASLLVALYHRSLGSGFKSFLVLAFGCGCAVLGAGSLLLVDAVVPTSLTKTTLLISGFSAGAMSGVLLGWGSFQLFRTGLGRLAKRYAPGL